MGPRGGYGCSRGSNVSGRRRKRCNTTSSTWTSAPVHPPDRTRPSDSSGRHHDGIGTPSHQSSVSHVISDNLLHVLGRAGGGRGNEGVGVPGSQGGGFHSATSRDDPGSVFGPGPSKERVGDESPTATLVTVGTLWSAVVTHPTDCKDLSKFGVGWSNRGKMFLL